MTSNASLRRIFFSLKGRVQSQWKALKKGRVEEIKACW